MTRPRRRPRRCHRSDGRPYRPSPSSVRDEGGSAAPRGRWTRPEGHAPAGPPPHRRSGAAMPLLRGIARTAVVAGTATAVSNRVSRRQAGRWAADSAPEPEAPAEPQAPPPPTRTDTNTKLAQLRELGQLRDSGVVDDAEFELQKSQILNS